MSNGVFVSGMYTKVRVATVREESRREIAAYVAEGSMSVDDAAKLMDAGREIAAESTLTLDFGQAFTTEFAAPQ